MLINPFLYRKKSELIALSDLAADAAAQLGSGIYTHIQNVPSATWVINHNLGRRPNVTVIDSAGTKWHGTETHVTVNQVVVTFKAGFSGVANCS